MRIFIWNLLGWIFIRWYNKILWKLNRFDHWRSFRRWMRYETKDALINHKLRYFIVKLIDVEDWYCPHCRYENFTQHEELFECISSGSCPEFEYWSGIQTCYRCGCKSNHSDST